MSNRAKMQKPLFFEGRGRTHPVRARGRVRFAN